MKIDLLCPTLCIAIEIDRKEYLSDINIYRRHREKDALLQENGYMVLRFLAEDIGKHFNEILDAILRIIIMRQK